MPITPVINIPQRVNGNNGTDFQIAQLHGIGTDAGFHAGAHTGHFANGSTCSCTIIAIAVIVVLSTQAGGVTHGGIRAHIHAADRQIKQVGLADKRHLGNADIKTNAAFFQILLYTPGSIQTESTSAAEQNGMDDLCGCHGFQQLTFAGGWSPAAHIQPSGRAIFAKQQYRAAGGGFRVFSIADLQPLEIGNFNFFHSHRYKPLSKWQNLIYIVTQKKAMGKEKMISVDVSCPI